MKANFLCALCGDYMPMETLRYTVTKTDGRKKAALCMGCYNRIISHFMNTKKEPKQ